MKSSKSSFFMEPRVNEWIKFYLQIANYLLFLKKNAIGNNNVEIAIIDFAIINTVSAIF